MVYPSYPDGILLLVDVPELVGNEAIVTDLNIEQTQPFLILWQANCFPCHKGRLVLANVSCPQVVSIEASDLPDDSTRHWKNADPELHHTI
jgi:hypothetical protein